MDFSNFSEEQIQAAREKVAIEKDDLAKACVDGSANFAEHVTEERKQERSVRYKQLAGEIRRGEHDQNLTTCQRIHYYLTGESVPLMNN